MYFDAEQLIELVHNRGIVTAVAEQCVGHRGQGHRPGADREAQGGAEHQRAQSGEEQGEVSEGMGGHTGRCAPLGRSHKG